MTSLVKWVLLTLAILVFAALAVWSAGVEQAYRANIRNGFPNKPSPFQAPTRVCPFDGRDLKTLQQYLERVSSTREDPDCVGAAIGRLGERHFAPAAPVLVKFLDFRWYPRGDAGKLHWPYPAVTALEEIGDASLPSILGVLEDNAVSVTSRENAITAWMGIYRYKEPIGIQRLRKEALDAADSSHRRLLLQASVAAAQHCPLFEKRKCLNAARRGSASSRD
jgi:hypothetical protein